LVGIGMEVTWLVKWLSVTEAHMDIRIYVCIHLTLRFHLPPV